MSTPVLFMHNKIKEGIRLGPVRADYCVTNDTIH